MREDKLNFGILIRIFVSLIPILFGMPTVAMIICSYNIAMTFLTAGPLATTVSSLCAVAAAMFLSESLGASGLVTGLVLGIQAVLCALGCIEGLFRKKDFFSGLTLASVGVLVPQLIHLNITAHKNGMSLAEMMVPAKEELRMMFDQTISITEEAGNAFAITPEIIDSVIEIARNITVMVIPSSLIIAAMITAYVVMWAVSTPLRVVPNKKIHSFSKLKTPWGFSILAIALMVVLLLIKGNTIVTTVALNMLMIIIAIALFSGMSLADFYFRKAIPFKFVRIIIHSLITINFFPGYVLAGFIDSFANFRKLPKNTVIKGGGEFETKK